LRAHRAARPRRVRQRRRGDRKDRLRDPQRSDHPVAPCRRHRSKSARESGPGRLSVPRIESLDFLYMPSTDVARDLAFYRDVIGAEVVFAIEAFGTRVAQVRLSDGGPRLLLAGHLEGEAPVVLHRVDDLEAAIADL